jgi:two-component system, NtrC family, sensor kinase
LQQLTEVSNDLADGNFDVNLDLDRPDELGVLAGSFRRMSEQLKASFGELEAANLELENRVRDRTAELEKTVQELRLTQTHMVQSEKISALGQLVTGITHEINTPVSFIHGNLPQLKAYLQDLLDLLVLYQVYLPHPPDEIVKRCEEVDVEFLTLEVQKVLRSMNVGTVRIREIVRSLRTFSRLEESEAKRVNLHHGLDSAVMMVRHRLAGTVHRPEIKLTQCYGSLPDVECFIGELTQAFLNLLNNAIEVLDEMELNGVDQAPEIIISTSLTRLPKGDRGVLIRIEDNGPGIPEVIRSQIFDLFSTTKSPIQTTGQSMGLGLAIAHQIVVEKHGGTIEVQSPPYPETDQDTTPVRSKGTAILIQLPM